MLKDHLLLIGTQSVRLIPRNSASGNFEFDRMVQLVEKEEILSYVTKLRDGEYKLFKEASKVWKRNILGDLISFSGGFWIKKTK